MTNIEAGHEEHQMSFAEAFLDTLKWGEVTVGVPLENFLQFIKDSPLDDEHMISKTSRRKDISLRLPARKGHYGEVVNQALLVTDADPPKKVGDEIVYTPKTYMAWVTRTHKDNGSYNYNVRVDTILKQALDNLESSLRGKEDPLIPDINLQQPEEELEFKQIEPSVQETFIPMPKAS